MTEEETTTGAPIRDRPMVLYDLLEQIAWFQAVGAAPVQVEQLAEEYRQLRAEL